MKKCSHCGNKVIKDKAMKLYHCSSTGNCKIASVLFTKEEWERRFCVCSDPFSFYQDKDKCVFCDFIIKRDR